MKIVPRTVSLFVAASHESSPPAARHVYERVGVRLKLAGTLLLRAWSLSKIGGVPVGFEQGEKGPGLAFRYQFCQSAAGTGISGGAASVWIAKTLSRLEHGLCSGFDFQTQPPLMCASPIAAVTEPTAFPFWYIVSRPSTSSGPFVIVAVFWRQRFPRT